MARRQVSIVRCDGDGCKEYAEVEDTTKTPDGWYQIRLAGPDNKLGNTGFDLHSLRCVERWAKGRKNALSSPKPTSNGSSAISPRNNWTNAESLIMETMQMWTGDFSISEIAEYASLNRSFVDKMMGGFLASNLIEMTAKGAGPHPSKYRWIGETEE